MGRSAARQAVHAPSSSSQLTASQKIIRYGGSGLAVVSAVVFIYVVALGASSTTVAWLESSDDVVRSVLKSGSPWLVECALNPDRKAASQSASKLVSKAANILGDQVAVGVMDCGASLLGGESAAARFKLPTPTSSRPVAFTVANGYPPASVPVKMFDSAAVLAEHAVNATKPRVTDIRSQSSLDRVLAGRASLIALTPDDIPKEDRAALRQFVQSHRLVRCGVLDTTKYRILGRGGGDLGYVLFRRVKETVAPAPEAAASDQQPPAAEEKEVLLYSRVNLTDVEELLQLSGDQLLQRDSFKRVKTQLRLTKPTRAVPGRGTRQRIPPKHSSPEEILGDLKPPEPADKSKTTARQAPKPTPKQRTAEDRAQQAVDAEYRAKMDAAAKDHLPQAADDDEAVEATGGDDVEDSDVIEYQDLEL